MIKLNDGGIACFGPAKDIRSIKMLLKKISEELGFKYDLKAIGDGDSNFYNQSYQVIVRKNSDLKFVNGGLNHF